MKWCLFLGIVAAVFGKVIFVIIFYMYVMYVMFYITYDLSVAGQLQLSDKDEWIRKAILARTNKCRSWHQAPAMVLDSEVRWE